MQKQMHIFNSSWRHITIFVFLPNLKKEVLKMGLSRQKLDQREKNLYILFLS